MAFSFSKIVPRCENGGRPEKQGMVHAGHQPLGRVFRYKCGNHNTFGIFYRRSKHTPKKRLGKARVAWGATYQSLSAP